MQSTITVQVNFLGPVQDQVGTRKMKVADLPSVCSLMDLLKNLAKKLGSKFQKTILNENNTENLVNENITIIINGRHYTHIDGLETPLKSGDEISFLNPLAGG